MTAKKYKEYFKNKRRNKKKTESLNSSQPSNKTIPCLSKDQPSANWLNFIKSNGVKGKVYRLRKPPMSEKPFEKKKKPPANTKVVALDCEMVSDINDENILARVSIVNFKLECIYDKYVKPTSKVGDYKTRFSGVREEDLNNGADFEEVQQEVRDLLFNKILVGHALHNDMRVLKFRHHRQLVRDTATYPPFKKVSDSRSPSLKKLAKVFLNENIQEGEHNSIEDARTAMKLYIKFRKEWETLLFKPKRDDLQSESFKGDHVEI